MKQETYIRDEQKVPFGAGQSDLTVTCQPDTNCASPKSFKPNKKNRDNFDRPFLRLFSKILKFSTIFSHT